MKRQLNIRASNATLAHLATIRTSLDLKSDAEAVAYALEQTANSTAAMLASKAILASKAELLLKSPAVIQNCPSEPLSPIPVPELLAQLQHTFKLMRLADMQAVILWRELNPGNDRVAPDHANLAVWLREQIERYNK